MNTPLMRDKVITERTEEKEIREVATAEEEEAKEEASEVATETKGREVTGITRPRGTSIEGTTSTKIEIILRPKERKYKELREKVIMRK